MKNTPEFRLWLQVMRQGLADLTTALSRAAHGRPGGEVDLEELRVWIFDAEGPGSFGWLCDAIDVDAGRARRVIESYWSRRLGGERVRLGIRRTPVTNGRMRVALATAQSRSRPTRQQNGIGGSAIGRDAALAVG